MSKKKSVGKAVVTSRRGSRSKRPPTKPNSRNSSRKGSVRGGEGGTTSSKKSFRIRRNESRLNSRHESSRVSVSQAGSRVSNQMHHRGFPSLMDLMNENKSLNEELRGYNKKLSRMIDYKGFSKLLSRIKKGKAVEFKHRPVSAKIRTLKKECDNNQSVLDQKKLELKRLGGKKKRLLNPIYITDINREIIQCERKIKNMKKEIHHIEITSKRDGKRVVKLHENIRSADSSIAINALINELDLVARNNYEVTDKIEEYSSSKEE